MIGGYFDDAVNIQMKLLGLETGRVPHRNC